MSDRTSVRTIRYLGNKRKLVPYIEAEIDRIIPYGGTVVDLFSGSSAIGYHLMRKYRIISNDAEPYAYCLAKALIEDCATTLPQKEISETFRSDYRANLRRLREVFRDIINEEARFFSKQPSARTYRKYCGETPYVANWSDNGVARRLKPVFEAASQGGRPTVYTLFSAYFMNSYFGAFQSLQIDSVRYAIDRTAGPATKPKSPAVFYKLIAALIYVVSYCVSSPGHFAQASSPNSAVMTSRLLKERAKDIWGLYLGYLDLLFSETRAHRPGNRAFQMDACELIDRLRVRPKDRVRTAIYIDPPYTADHYSRFYHLLNTLMLYDYPACVGKGRYRDDRYASPFSMKSTASSSLYNLLLQLAQLRVPVLMSYTSAGILSLAEVASMCKDVFPHVKSLAIPYNHSFQGRRKIGSEDNDQKGRIEAIFVCRFL